MMKNYQSILILIYILLAVINVSKADLPLPVSKDEMSNAVRIPLAWQEDRILLSQKSVNRLWKSEQGLNFMTEGQGEGFDIGSTNFDKIGEYRVFILSSTGWPKGNDTPDRFVLEIDSQPMIIYNAKGTDGATKVQWIELNRINMNTKGEKHLVLRHVVGDEKRKVQYIISELAFIPVKKPVKPSPKVKPVDKEGWIRTWLIGGPFGMSGVSSVAPHYERYFQPTNGSTRRQYWLDTPLTIAWKQYTSPENRVRMDVPETFAKRPEFAWPVGRPGCAYAHLYVKWPSQMDVLLDFESSVQAEIWLNGRILRPDKEVLAVDADGGFDRGKNDHPLRTAVTMQPGTNRLAVKLFFPQAKYRPREDRKEKGVWFKCRFLDITGNPMRGAVIAHGYAQANHSAPIEYHVNPPDLVDAKKQYGRRLGDVTEMEFACKESWNVFQTEKPIQISGEIKLLSPIQRLERFGFNNTRYDSVPQEVSVYSRVYDFDGRVVARNCVDVKYDMKNRGTFKINLGKLNRGHYTIYSEIRKGTKLVSQPQPTMIAVVDPPTLPVKGVHSKFAHSFYYLFNPPEAKDIERFLRLLAMAKVRWNIGSSHKWWITDDPRHWVKLPEDKRTWPRAPKRECLKTARSMGIEIVGQLGAFHKAIDARGFRNKPEIADHLIVNDFYDLGSMDSPEVQTIIDTYVYETVRKFKNQYRYWKLDNEMNLRGFSPAELVLLHKWVNKAMKRADPDAKLWSGSISTFDLPYVEKMLQMGLDRYIDVYDYHYYIWPQGDPTYQNMGGLPKLLSVFSRYGVKVPVANGEFGCYRSIHQDGARMQAAMMAQGLIVAHTYSALQWIAPHFPTELDFCVHNSNGIYPSYLAYRTAADILEGSELVGKIKLGKNIAAWKFKRPSGKKVIALWDSEERTVTLPKEARGWRAFDILGRRVKSLPGNRLKLSVFPMFVTNGRLNEGTVPTPLPTVSE